MRIVMFYHSLISDWNHGNAHFLRGVVTELLARGHVVDVYEPRHGWSLKNLRAEQGNAPLLAFKKVYPRLQSKLYDFETLDLDRALEDADLVLVHEWNAHALVRAIGKKRLRQGHFRLLFHDTHHRSVTRREEMEAYDLANYDGALLFGNVIRDLYLKQGWTKQAWTWHEAADTRVFHYRRINKSSGDLVWIGNWGDNERTAELHEFLIQPIARLKLKAQVHGVRYPDEGKQALKDAGIKYCGWLPNFEVPSVFARHRVTVHVPRRPYQASLPGIPTIRIFEALACGIPLVSAPWSDEEQLFTPGKDFLVARDGAEMEMHLRSLLSDKAQSKALAEHGLQTILRRHTCSHRVDELLAIAEQLGIQTASKIMKPKQCGNQEATRDDSSGAPKVVLPK
jgi:spore maturation protein CgeB